MKNPKHSDVQDPQTLEEWQEAVDAAELLLVIDSAKQYGLIEGGPKTNQARCAEILDRGRALGHRPKPIRELVKEAF